MQLTFVLPRDYRRHGVLQQECAVSTVELDVHELVMVSAARMRWRGRRRKEFCAAKVAAYVWLPDWISAAPDTRVDMLGRVLLDVPRAFNRRRLPEFPHGCTRLEWVGEWRPVSADA
ncbi:hypothetical protein [Trinickia dinghuensis]|uniref:Uncharacterized protein n=1 Tax=Trinickia dinghuensis TaxID=2291023 RepID=A0A3D8K2Y1_9BURK|nr:hypothetical protein [Trinickia dinghuensis]RDU99214.1 hypothetical protein DWV00_08805 [Trinickia dinghuensis]